MQVNKDKTVTKMFCNLWHIVSCLYGNNKILCVKVRSRLNFVNQEKEVKNVIMETRSSKLK